MTRMRYRFGCEVSLRVATCPDDIELQRHGIHEKNSHDKDDLKTPKYDEIESVTDATKCPRLCLRVPVLFYSRTCWRMKVGARWFPRVFHGAFSTACMPSAFDLSAA